MSSDNVGQRIFMWEIEDSKNSNNLKIRKPEKLAMREKYFQDVTLEFLWEKFIDNDSHVVFDKLSVLSFRNHHLQRLGDLSKLVSNLRVCNLSSNFLRDITGILTCVNLQKLDINGNQISHLPDQQHWSNMQHLEFLYLHDNAVASLEDVENISGCPNLLALTLYDTPLSLQGIYRYCTVNSIKSLKALDQFVIADEEVIDHLNHSDRYAAFRKELKVDLYPAQTQKNGNQGASLPCHQLPSAVNEFELIKNIRKRINGIISHHSPVVIIQKYIRGYLSRCRVTKLKAKHLRSTDPFKLYGSKSLSELPPLEEMKHQTEKKQKLLHPKQDFKLVPIPSLNKILNPTRIKSPDYSQFSFKALANINGNNCGFYQNILKTDYRDKEKNSIILKNKKNAKYKNQTTNFLRETLDVGESGEYFHFNFTGEDVPISTMHLQGRSKPIHKVYAFTNLTLENHLISTAIKTAHSQYHQVANVPKPESLKVPVDLDVIMSERKQLRKEKMYNRLFKHVSKSCIFSVQQAYEEHRLAEKKQIQRNEIYQRKIEEQLKKQKRKEIKLKKHCQQLAKNEEEKTELNKIIEKKDLEKQQHFTELQMKKLDFSKVKSEMEAERKFVMDFSCKHMSISRTLMQHNESQVTFSQKSFCEKQQQEQQDSIMDHYYQQRRK